MSKHSRTDDGAFNSLRFNKIDFQKDRIAAQKAKAKADAERIAAILACIEADEKKIKRMVVETPSISTAPKEDAVRYSGNKAEYFRNSLVTKQ
jgi:hypothetical protein